MRLVIDLKYEVAEMQRSIVDIKKEFKGKKVAIIPGFHLGNWALRGNKYSQLQVSDTLRPAVDKQGTYIDA